MNSSKNKTARNLAKENRENMLLGLKELANLRDDPAAFGRFVQHWPGFVHLDEAAYQLRGGEKIPDKFGALVERREALRKIWRGAPFTLRQLLLPSAPPEELRGQYFDRDLLADEKQEGISWDTQIDLDWE